MNKDYWAGRFTEGAMHNAGGGYAMYRTCLRCGGQVLDGSLSPHARWCDKQILAAFDALAGDDRRAIADHAAEVRRAARSAL